MTKTEALKIAADCHAGHGDRYTQNELWAARSAIQRAADWLKRLDQVDAIDAWITPL